MEFLGINLVLAIHQESDLLWRVSLAVPESLKVALQLLSVDLGCFERADLFHKVLDLLERHLHVPARHPGPGHHCAVPRQLLCLPCYGSQGLLTRYLQQPVNLILIQDRFVYARWEATPGRTNS